MKLHDGNRFDLSGDDRVLASQKFHEYSDGYFIQDDYATPIQSGTTTYDISVVARDSIEVTGRIMNPPYFTDDVQIEVRGGMWLGRFRPETQFHVKGVRKGAPAELFVTYKGNAFHSFQLNATQTQSNFDLGDITLSYIPLGSRDRNAAITAFSVRRYPLDKSRFEAMIEITNTSAEDLDLYLDGCRMALALATYSDE